MSNDWIEVTDLIFQKPSVSFLMLKLLNYQQTLSRNNVASAEDRINNVDATCT